VSSPLATYIGVRLEQFRYLTGEPAAYTSSAGVQRYFCRACGTPMAYTSAQWPPTGHAFSGVQLAWFEVADHLPRYLTTAGKGAKPLRHGARG
jgi:hypothetical protein